MIVKVCDMLTGGGKTSAAITLMNEDTEHRYMFITPYLDEVERIIQACKSRHFCEPISHGEGKLVAIHDLIRDGRCIASTHALFGLFTDETWELIKNGEYTLILDEVVDVVEPASLSAEDFKMLLDQNVISVDEDGWVTWVDGDYKGGLFGNFKEQCTQHRVRQYGNYSAVCMFDERAFTSFADMILLTYMFEAQIMKFYFQDIGVETTKIGTKKDGNVYRFSDICVQPEITKDLINKIHFVVDSNAFKAGYGKTDLSSTWYKQRIGGRSSKIEAIRSGIKNVFVNKLGAKSDDILWTTFKIAHDSVKGRGYTRGFIPCKLRATNAYADRKYLAYCVNIFAHPSLVNYYAGRGIQVPHNLFALSEMVQWVWRSAIRRGEDIYLFVPSRRMRLLFRWWLQKLADGETEFTEEIEWKRLEKLESTTSVVTRRELSRQMSAQRKRASKS